MEKTVICCLCEKEVNWKITMTPGVCYKKYMDKSHRICFECWFNPTSGFVLENRSHKCPGCMKEMPLTNVSYNESEVFDLTDY